MLKDSQNSLEALMLTVMIYCRERVEIRISQGRRYTGQGHASPTAGGG